MNKLPYPGLRPFRRDEADIFFGRSALVAQLLDKLYTTRFLAVVGLSGCGKSSLVQAGMLNDLEAGFIPKAGAVWRIAQLRPRRNPMEELTQALFNALEPERDTQPDSAAFLRATLDRGPKGLVETLEEKPSLPKDTNLLILVDQFEEVFRYRQYHSRDEAEAFVALLLESAKEREGKTPIYVVITMRSEFLGDCALFRGLPEALNESLFLIPRLTREQRREAIEGPAQMYGGKVEPSLVNQLLNDIEIQLLNDTVINLDPLPLLQHALMRLWKKASQRDELVTLTLDDYKIKIKISVVWKMPYLHTLKKHTMN